jgi:hypothetical protein
VHFEVLEKIPSIDRNRDFIRLYEIPHPDTEIKKRTQSPPANRLKLQLDIRTIQDARLQSANSHSENMSTVTAKQRPDLFYALGSRRIAPADRNFERSLQAAR